MNRNLITPVLLLAAGLAAACASTPPGSPEEVATALVADLDAGRADAADDLFDRVDGDESYRQRIYPIVYDAARERYRRGDAEAAARLLRFMAPRYPEAGSVHEALLYSLFLERARADDPDPELAKEIDAALARVQAEGSPPPWADLVAAQQAVDRDDPEAVRESLARFLQDWEGQPPELMLYVEDLERYVAAHGNPGGTR